MQPLFTIVIPSYNRGHLILKAIRSVLSQTFNDFEIIVVDDGSTDDTESVVKKLSNQKLKYYKIENSERGAARNFGGKCAQGKYLTFLDSDDVLYTNHLKKAADFIEQFHPVVFHQDFEMISEEGRLLKTFTVSAINKKILSGNLLSCNGVFIRREDFLNNLFCEDRKMASLEDWELWIRLAAKFNFDYHHAVTSAIVNHLDRSVMTVNKERIKTKVDLFIDKVMNNPHNQLSYGKRLQWAQASALTYAALHLSLAKEKKTVVINYLWKAILISPREIFKKRFLVIIKNLVLPYSVH